jgi:hypothetical protein
MTTRIFSKNYSVKPIFRLGSKDPQVEEKNIVLLFLLFLPVDERQTH